MFGTKESFVPLADARIEGDTLVVPHDKAKVKDAPKVDDDGHIGDDEQAELYRYYGLAGVSSNGHDGFAGRADAGTSGVGTTDSAVGHENERGAVGTTPPGPPRTTP